MIFHLTFYCFAYADLVWALRLMHVHQSKEKHFVVVFSIKEFNIFDHYFECIFFILEGVYFCQQQLLSLIILVLV